MPSACVATSSCRPAPGSARAWPTWCPLCSRAAGWWSRPPPRPCRTSWRPDLPFLQEHLSVPFEFAVLKGRSNYLCRQKALEVLGAAISSTSPGAADAPGQPTAAALGPSAGRCAASSTGAATTESGRSGRAVLRASGPGVGRCSVSVPSSAPAPTAARPATSAWPRRPGTGPRRRTWSSSTPTCTRPIWPPAAPFSRPTTWSSSTRPTSSRTWRRPASGSRWAPAVSRPSPATARPLVTEGAVLDAIDDAGAQLAAAIADLTGAPA